MLLPLDRGVTLLAGLRGVLYSVPELAFVNIRKGTFDGVDRRYWPSGSCGPRAGPRSAAPA